MILPVLDHVQLAAPAGCEPAARAFYGDLLGLAEIPKPPGVADTGGAWFACGRGELHVGVERAFAPARKAHPGLAVETERELRRLADSLERAGHTVRWDTRLPEVPRFYVEDPWGNRVELRAATRAM